MEYLIITDTENFFPNFGEAVDFYNLYGGRIFQKRAEGVYDEIFIS